MKILKPLFAFVVTLVASCLIVSCASLMFVGRTYSGAPLPKDKVAFLRGFDWVSHAGNISVINFDGVAANKIGGNIYEILPGDHELTVALHCSVKLIDGVTNNYSGRSNAT